MSRVPLDGSRLKLDRAEAHRQMLNREFQRYWSGNAHEVVTEQDPQTGEVVLRAQVNQVPDPMWSVIVGEFVHDARSALDYLIWGLSEVHRGPAPNPIPRGKAGRPWRRAQFPIFTDPNDYTDLAPNMISLVDPAHWARIDAEQPYHAGKDARWQPLALLNELSNIDKHRELQILLGHAWNQGQYLSGIETDNCVVVGINVRGTGAVEDGTELARIQLQVTGPNPKVQMQHQFVFGVTFAEPTLTWHPSIDVLTVMTMIGVEARSVIDRFAPLFP